MTSGASTTTPARRTTHHCVHLKTNPPVDRWLKLATVAQGVGPGVRARRILACPAPSARCPVP
eukprot:2594816-Alexandrium_andersonii.AAC.1